MKPEMSWAGMSDAQIIQGVAHHDEQALRELYRRHAGCLLALAGQQQLAQPQQAVEDTFILIWRHASCQDHSPLDGRAWLIGLAARHFRSCPKKSREA